MAEKAVVRPRLSAQERRASIVEAAVRLFSEKGFRGTTTRELAAAVGVTEPVLYEHFRTKSELYTAMIDAKVGESLAHLRDLASRSLAAEDDEGFFLAVARMVFDFHMNKPEFFRLLLFSALEGHELKDLMHERKVRAFHEIASGYLERRMEQGCLRRMNTALMASALVGMVSDYGVHRALHQCPSPPEGDDEVIRQMVGIFLDGARTKCKESA